MQHDNPYSAPGARLVDVPDEQVLADRWLRLGAAMLDGFLMMLIVFPLMYLGGYFEGMLRGQRPDLPTQLMWGGIGFALFVVIQGFPLYTSGQTWAKKLLKIKIVDLDGNKPEFVRLVALRYLTTQAISLVPFVGALYGLVDSLFIFSDDRRCLHDRIAGTRVVIVNPASVEFARTGSDPAA
ncbi:MAG: RDD family protein [Arenimonas sp.]